MADVKVYIEHNPYKPFTKILIDDEPVKDNSLLNYKERPFQEWVEGLPADLCNECADNSFHITFHGTLLDYEDLKTVADSAKNEGIEIEHIHQPAKEVKDKEKAIDEIFQEIINNQYFESLKSPDMLEAFKLAKSKEFPVNVIATMSSGKSTLINALLGQKLMPAMQEACTATITEIHDDDNEHFIASAFDANDLKLRFCDPLDLSNMEKLNNDPEVSKIIAYGNIPFVSSKDVSLVLVDTPGPNNARNDEHRVATFRMLSESSKPLVLYVLNATQLAINDDNALLSQVAETMKVGGKQSKDRYIFVLNKVDDFKAGEDSVDSVIQNAREYLADKGIENPNIYPASALAALEIRSDFKDIDVNQLTPAQMMKDANLSAFFTRVVKLNSDLHLDEYAPLADSIKSKLEKQLVDAKDSGDIKEEALIHSGIKSIEAAISVYVEKYAKTAKIRGIVTTFSQNLESQRLFELTRQKIVENTNEKEKIRASIQTLKSKINDAKNAKEFKDTINALDFKEEVKKETEKIIAQAQTSVREQIETLGNTKLDKCRAEQVCRSFANFSKNLQAQVCVDIENRVNEFIIEKCDQLTNAYMERLKSFSEDVFVSPVNIDPVKIMSGEIDSLNKITAIISSATKTERECVGKEWVKNNDKKWYKPWTWFQKSGEMLSIYADREYVDGKKLADAFFAPVQENLHTNEKAINKSTETQVNKVKQEFEKKFDDLDAALNAKLDELGKCTDHKRSVDATIKETTKRLNWLTDIQNRVNAILEI